MVHTYIYIQCVYIYIHTHTLQYKYTHAVRDLPRRRRFCSEIAALRRRTGPDEGAGRESFPGRNGLQMN